MEKETRQEFWDELKLIQPIIDKFDKAFFQMKSWFLAGFVGIAGYSLQQRSRRFSG